MKGRKKLHNLPLAMPLRAQPPDYLTDQQAAVWQEMFASRPLGYFAQSDAPLLAALCVATSEHRRLAHELEDETDLSILSRVSRLMDMHAARITSISTRLRLTPQSRYTPELAAAQVRVDAAPGPDLSGVAVLNNYRSAAKA